MSIARHVLNSIFTVASTNPKNLQEAEICQQDGRGCKCFNCLGLLIGKKVRRKIKWKVLQGRN